MSKWTGPNRAEDNYSPTPTSATKQRGLPVTTADLKALNERVTELRRKMPDDEPSTILARLHEGGEFLWADEAHIDGALLRPSVPPTQARPTKKKKWIVSVPATMSLEVEADTEEEALQAMIDGAVLTSQFDYDGPWGMEPHWDDPTVDILEEEAEEEGQGA